MDDTPLVPAIDEHDIAYTERPAPLDDCHVAGEACRRHRAAGHDHQTVGQREGRTQDEHGCGAIQHDPSAP